LTGIESNNSDALDFEASSKRSLRQRMKYSFIWTYKPIIDDGPGFRAFTRLADYKRWAQKLPEFLGYGKKV